MKFDFLTPNGLITGIAIINCIALSYFAAKAEEERRERIKTESFWAGVRWSTENEKTANKVKTLFEVKENEK